MGHLQVILMEASKDRHVKFIIIIHFNREVLLGLLVWSYLDSLRFQPQLFNFNSVQELMFMDK